MEPQMESVMIEEREYKEIDDDQFLCFIKSIRDVLGLKHWQVELIKGIRERKRHGLH